MEQMMGSATSVSGNTFALSMMQGARPISFQTASGTQFENMAGMNMMSDAMLLSVDAVIQPDGTALAQRVDFTMGSGGMMSDGIVTSVKRRAGHTTQPGHAKRRRIGGGSFQLRHGFHRESGRRHDVPDRFRWSRQERL